MQHFHAHVYFGPQQDAEIDAFLDRFAEEAPPLRFHRLHEKRVGPHALPMLELHFTVADHKVASIWLEANRGNLSVLIHADTGDDVRDHTTGIRWLGQPLPLDFGFFKRVAESPELALHPIQTRAAR